MDEADKVHWPAELEDLPERDIPWSIYYKLRHSMFSPTMHWCFLTEVIEVQFFIRPRVLVRTVSGNKLTVHFYHEQHEEPTTFNWAQLVPGSTLAIMYAESKHMLDLTKGIRQENLDSVFVFKASLSEVNEAIQWCTKSKSSSSTVASKCSTNACNTMDRLKTCARCNYAKYCSKEHQISDWKRHKMICSDMKTILRLVECISKKFRGISGFIDFHLNDKDIDKDDEFYDDDDDDDDNDDDDYDDYDDSDDYDDDDDDELHQNNDD